MLLYGRGTQSEECKLRELRWVIAVRSSHCHKPSAPNVKLNGRRLSALQVLTMNRSIFSEKFSSDVSAVILRDTCFGTCKAFKFKRSKPPKSSMYLLNSRWVLSLKKLPNLQFRQRWLKNLPTMVDTQIRFVFYAVSFGQLCHWSSLWFFAMGLWH